MPLCKERIRLNHAHPHAKGFWLSSRRIWHIELGKAQSYIKLAHQNFPVKFVGSRMQDCLI